MKKIKEVDEVWCTVSVDGVVGNAVSNFKNNFHKAMAYAACPDQRFKSLVLLEFGKFVSFSQGYAIVHYVVYAQVVGVV